MPRRQDHFHGHVTAYPFPTEKDLLILEELLDSSEEAHAMLRILANCPPEIAAIASLNLRLFSEIKKISVK